MNEMNCREMLFLMKVSRTVLSFFWSWISRDHRLLFEVNLISLLRNQICHSYFWGFNSFCVISVNRKTFDATYKLNIETIISVNCFLWYVYNYWFINQPKRNFKRKTFFSALISKIILYLKKHFYAYLNRLIIIISYYYLQLKAKEIYLFVLFIFIF